MAQTMEQKRAAFAWDAAGEGTGKTGDKYSKLAKGAPALIMSSGLMQTLAFLRDKGEVHHQLLLKHLLQWMAHCFDGEATQQASHPFPRKVQPDFVATMQALFNARPAQYQRATSEAMSVLRWIRQLAAAR